MYTYGSQSTKAVHSHLADHICQLNKQMKINSAYLYSWTGSVEWWVIFAKTKIKEEKCIKKAGVTHKLFSSNTYNIVISKQIFLRRMIWDYDPSKAVKSCGVKEIPNKLKEPQINHKQKNPSKTKINNNNKIIPKC